MSTEKYYQKNNFDIEIHCSDGTLYFSRYVLSQYERFRVSMSFNDQPFQSEYTTDTMSVLLSFIDPYNHKPTIEGQDPVLIFEMAVFYDCKKLAEICISVMKENPDENYIDLPFVTKEDRLYMLKKLIKSGRLTNINDQIIREMLGLGYHPYWVLAFIQDKYVFTEKTTELFDLIDEAFDFILDCLINKTKPNPKILPMLERLCYDDGFEFECVRAILKNGRLNMEYVEYAVKSPK